MVSEKLSLLQVLLYFIFSTRYDDKDYSLKSTLAAALGSVQISQIKGCACKPNLSFFPVLRLKLILLLLLYCSVELVPGVTKGYVLMFIGRVALFCFFTPFTENLDLRSKVPIKAIFCGHQAKMA
jgi:hypothetical protein